MMQAFMPRGLLFLWSGVLHNQALPVWLYAGCTVIAMSSLVGGSCVNKHVNQAVFAQLLSMLVVVAAILMISAGSGLMA